MALSIPIISEYDGKGISRAIAEFKNLETAGEKAQFAIKKAALPAAAALAGLAAAAGPAIMAASDLEENLSKVNVVFGEGAASIENFAKTAATSLGQSQNAVLQAAGTFGTFGKAAGLSGQDLATFSNDFTALASDLASFNNTTPEQAINAIGSALRGEAEPLRQFGVLLSDAALREEALSMGLEVSTGALSAQTKILAAQSLIYKQTGDAQGDFARTSDGLANSSRVLKAQMADLQVSIGKALLPAVQAVLPVVKDFATWAANNPQNFTRAAAAIATIATAILAVNFAMNASPFVLWTTGILAVGVAIFAAYQKFEGFRTGVNMIMNAVIGYINGVISAMYMLYNAVAMVLNAIPGLDNIATRVAPQIPTMGGTGTSAVSGGGAAREGGTGSFGGATLPNIASIPIMSPAITSGGGGGGGGGGSFTPVVSGGGPYVGPSNIPGFTGGNAERIASMTVNVNGGLSTSADIGEAVVNALRAYNRSAGPLQLEIA
jgi:hypothetical protein